MKEVSQELQASLSSEATTLCFCWKLTRRDGVVLGFTDHDCNLTIDGLVHESRSGFEGGEIEELEGLSPDTTAISGGLSSDSIKAGDIRSGRYDGASIELWLVNWKNTGERMLQGSYELGEVTTSGAVFKADLKTAASRLDETVGRCFNRRCDAEFGDGRCRVNLDNSGHCVTTTLSRQVGASVLEVAGLADIEPQWFSNGRLEWLDGPLAGETAVIAEHNQSPDATSITMWEPVHGEIPAGTGIRLVAGCDKTFVTCRDRFANSLNFQGYPHVPGNDFAFNYASNSSLHDESPVIP